MTGQLLMWNDVMSLFRENSTAFNLPLKDVVARAGGVGSLLPPPPPTLPPLSFPSAPGTNSIPPQRPEPAIAEINRVKSNREDAKTASVL